MKSFTLAIVLILLLPSNGRSITLCETDGSNTVCNEYPSHSPEPPIETEITPIARTKYSRFILKRYPQT